MMKTINDILKKSLSLLAITAVTCLLFGSFCSFASAEETDTGADATANVGSNNATNPYLKEKKDCSSMSGNAKTECEKRNQAIDEGGQYCKVVKPGEGKADVAGSCIITTVDNSSACNKKTKQKGISKEITNAINAAAKQYNLSPTFLASFINLESNFNVNAKNSSTTASGLGQILQGTWNSHCVQTCGSFSENRFKADKNLMCASKILSDYKKQILQRKNRSSYAGINVNDDDLLIYAYFQGVGGLDKAVNAGGVNWKNASAPASSTNTSGLSYINTVNCHMKNIAPTNGCASRGGQFCEYFYYGAGDSYGTGTADDVNATLTNYFTNYKCSLSENFNQIQGCLFCPLFRTIFNAASQIAKSCHEKFSSSLIKLLAIGLAISLAWIIMQYVSDMTQKDPGILLNTIFRKIFVVVVIITLLKIDVASFFNMFVTPVFDTGFKIAELAINNTGVDLPDGAGTVDGSGLPAKMGISMLKGIYAVQNRLEKLMALGSNSICIALYVKSYHGYPIFPHFGYLLTGIFLWIAAMVFMVVYPFLLIDSVLQFTIASSLFPAALAASAFEVTKKYLNIFKVIHIFISAMFVFIFITIILFILLSGMDDSLLPIVKRAADVSDDSYFDLEGFLWYSKEFIKLIFFLFLGKAVLEDIPGFAEDFAKPLSMGESGGKPNLGIGRNVGGLAARGATGLATGAGSIALGATKTTTSLAGKGLREAGGQAWADIRSIRHNYLMNRTQKKLAAANAAAAASGSPAVRSVTGRNFWGQKVTRSVITNPDGTMALQSTRKSLIRRREVSVLADENMSIKRKISKNGAVRESYKMNSVLARSLINKDGTINQKVMAQLMQNSSLPKDVVNKAILNQLLQQRLPNAGRKVGFKLGWPPVTVNRGASLEGGFGSTGAFVSEKINSYIDDKGREVFEVRRVGLDGNTSVYRMVKGNSRALVEYERITKNGNAHKWSSDGVIQKKESGRYTSNINYDPKNQADAPAQVTINGAEVKDAHIGSDGVVTDKDGNFVGMIQANGNIVNREGNVVGTGKAADLIFDQNGRALGKIKAANQAQVNSDGALDIKGQVIDSQGNVSAYITGDGQIIDAGKQNVIGLINDDQNNYLGKAKDEFNRNGYRAAKTEFSHARAYKGAKIFDDDGIIEDDWKDEELMFDDNDLNLYKEQMKKYGDVINHHAFGR